MTKLMLTGASIVMASAMISAIVMIANAPAQTQPVLDPALHAATDAGRNATRITLRFEPNGEAVDRQ